MTRKRMQVSKDLGERLRAARVSRRLSQDAAAKAAGVSQHVISCAERGGVSTGIANLEAIVRVYGVTIGELIEQAQPKRSLPNSVISSFVRPSFSVGFGYTVPAAGARPQAKAPVAPTDADQLKTIIAQLHPVLSRMDGLKDLPAVRAYAGAVA